MERVIRKLLLAWLLLLGTQLLTQELSLPGGARLGAGLFWVIVFTSPVVALLILGLSVIRIRETIYRLRVLRRAAKWKWKKPPTAWPEEEWDG